MLRVVFSAIEDLLRPISGPVGIRLRRMYYGRKCKHFGSNVTIEVGVTIVHPEHVSVGNGVWIDRNVTLIAGPHNKLDRIRRIAYCEVTEGSIEIGDNSHLGIGTIVQGHAGVVLGENFTSSAYCCIYSLSNDPEFCRYGTVAGEVYYVASPVCIGANVWVGLHSVILGCDIGDDCFVRPFAVVKGKFKSDQVISGSPAVSIGKRLRGSE